MTWLTLLLACDSPRVSPPDTDTDTDADADADADTDTDTDADADADADTDADTGDTGALCGTAAALVAIVEAHDHTGACASCVGAEVSLVARLTNPCPVDVTIDKFDPETLLVESWHLGYPDGTNLDTYAYYYGPPRAVVVPAFGEIDQELAIAEAIGPLGSGTWTVGATLATVLPFSAVASFDVP